VEKHGPLTAVSWKLLERAEGLEDVASVERALRRLRERGQRDGWVWGQRRRRRFGVPRAIEDRLRWMCLYQSPFNDLPLTLCEDQVRLWDQPPISASRARVWLQLASTSMALRRRAFAPARVQLEAVAQTLAVSGADAARYADASIEAALACAYLESRIGSDPTVDAYLNEPSRRNRAPSSTPETAPASSPGWPISVPSSATARAITREHWRYVASSPLRMSTPSPAIGAMQGSPSAACASVTAKRRGSMPCAPARTPTMEATPACG